VFACNSAIPNQGECLSNEERKYSCTGKRRFLIQMLCLLCTDCSDVKGLITTGKVRVVTQTQRPLHGLLLIIELNRHCVGNILVDIMTPYDRVRKCNFTRKYQQSTLFQNVYS
jgi:hypothetical protein